MPVVSGDYSDRIVRKQGGSVMGIASGGSMEFDAGGVILASGTPVFSGGFNFGQASLLVLSGGLVSPQTGSSFTVNITTEDQGTFKINDGTLGPTIGVGRNVPTYSASPGSIFLRSDGSVSLLYWNKSSGTTGSVWTNAASG